MRKRTTPLGALVRGLVAGAAGSALIGMFFKATARVAPPPPDDAFAPPEVQQNGELAHETVARRTVEQLMQREPLSAEAKARGGEVVHFAFGSGWGGLYGLVRETVPGMCGVLGAVGFGAAVWMVSDNVILPAFRLGPPMTRVPVQNHAYALAAHVVYGLATWASYQAMRPQTAATLGSLWWTLSARRRLGRFAPARRAVNAILTPRNVIGARHVYHRARAAATDALADLRH